MNVRSYQPGDAVAIARLFTESVHSSAAADYSPEQVLAWAPDPPEMEDWRRQLSSLVCFVAEIDSEIVGFITFEPDGHLYHLYVHSLFQRKGAASALYQFFESEMLARGIHRVFTEASITARPFFERAGLRVIDVQEFEYRGVRFINYRMEKFLS